MSFPNGNGRGNRLGFGGGNKRKARETQSEDDGAQYRVRLEEIRARLERVRSNRPAPPPVTQPQGTANVQQAAAPGNPNSSQESVPPGTQVVPDMVRYQHDTTIHRNKPNLRQLPKLPWTPVLLILPDRGSAEFGHPHHKKNAPRQAANAPFLVRNRVLIHIDCGRLGQAGIALKIQLPKNRRSLNLNTASGDDRRVATLRWSVGVKVAADRHQLARFKCQAKGELQATYTAEKKVPRCILESDYDGNMEGLVCIEFEGDSAEVVVEDFDAFIDCERDLVQRNALHSLFTESRVRAKVYIKPDSVDTLVTNIGHFSQQFRHMYTPLRQYLTPNSSDLDIGLDMPAVDLFANRSLAKYGKSEEQRMQAEISQRGSVQTWPTEITGVEQLRETTTFDDEKTLGIYTTLSIVRNFQYEQAMNSELSSLDIKFKFAKGFERPETADMSYEQKVQQKMFYIFGTLPKDAADIVSPAPGTQWEVALPYWFADRTFVPPTRKQLYLCTCVAVTREEKQHVGGADFAFVGRVKDFPEVHIKIANSFSEVDPNVHFRWGRMKESVDHEVAAQTLKAVKRVCRNENSNYSHILSVLTSNGSLPRIATQDLTPGPARMINSMPIMDRDRRSQEWEYRALILAGLWPETTHLQSSLINDAPKSMWLMMAILGGPGCVKTSTTAMLLNLLAASDHKILVLSKTNSPVNNMMQALEKVRRRFVTEGPAIIRRTGGAVHANIRVGVEPFGRLQMLRYMPPTVEVNTLQEESRAVHDNNTFTLESSAEQMRQAYDEDNRQMDMVEQMTAMSQIEQQIMAVLGQRQDQVEGETNDAFAARRAEESALRQDANDLKQKQAEVQGMLDRLRMDYERAPITARKGFEFPLNHALCYQINKFEGQHPVQPLGATALAKFSAIRKWRAAEADYEAQRETLASRDDRRDAIRAIAEARIEVFSAFVESQNIVGATYGNSTDQCIAKFKPDIVVHEEASQATLGDAMCGFSFETGTVHIFLGDTLQMPPYDRGNHWTEVEAITKKSVLQVLLDLSIVPYPLVEQFRMHPSIMQFPNEEFYDGMLIAGKCTKQDHNEQSIARQVMQSKFHSRNPDASFDGQYYLVNNVAGACVQDADAQSTSRVNYAEASSIVALCVDLVQAGIRPPTISVLCLYSAQAALVNRKMRAAFKDIDTTGAVQVTTVDSFQGDENEIVLVALSISAGAAAGFLQINRSKKSTTSTLSSFAKNAHRLNVALTRAKYLAVIFGHFNSVFESCRESLRALTGNKNTGGAGVLYNMIVDADERKVLLVDWTSNDHPKSQKFLQDNNRAQDWEKECQSNARMSGISVSRKVLTRKKADQAAFGAPTPGGFVFSGPGFGTEASFQLPEGTEKQRSYAASHPLLRRTGPAQLNTVPEPFRRENIISLARNSVGTTMIIDAASAYAAVATVATVAQPAIASESATSKASKPAATDVVMGNDGSAEVGAGMEDGEIDG
ncbi:uncharacterized protein HMPREF1541_08904 [Cyphellophora europaea CBS 101466]|uniref:DNA2/NAM7 helicase-like C-terminal domain-containing protein n=1 Tax=Cyphellophora europaea (strain CBS 101466) TaxID=1220924 RepID=W2RJH1_CYPE1|nr:uncharacterized protein HMPREF1541_08904 [Cyphellophora europaea CBS 101466]ETN36626.1 hypothetical protein HMPREF1541_08904 [Cyphellophora europaea CBS 101466]